MQFGSLVQPAMISSSYSGVPQFEQVQAADIVTKISGVERIVADLTLPVPSDKGFSREFGLKLN